MNGQIYPCCSGATNIWKYQYNAKKTIYNRARRMSQKLNEDVGFCLSESLLPTVCPFLIFPFSQRERSLTTKLKVSNTRAVIIPPKETCPQKTSRHYRPNELILWKKHFYHPSKKSVDVIMQSQVQNWLIVHESKSCAVSAAFYWQ